MRRILYPKERFPDGHIDLAFSLTDLGLVLHDRGDLAGAEPLLREALAMCRTLFPRERLPDGHPDLAICLYDLGLLLWTRGDLAGADLLLLEALEMNNRLARSFADLAAEAEVLNFLASQTPARSGYLSLTASLDGQDPGRASAPLWAGKGLLLHALAQRQRLLHADPELRPRIDQLLAVRQELARWVLSPAPELNDEVRRQRLRQLTERKEELERELVESIPEVRRLAARQLPSPADLSGRLPAGAAFVDLFHYRAWDAKKRAWTEYRYAAFVLAKGGPIRRVELGAANVLDKAVDEWRSALLAQPVTERGVPREESPSDRAAQQRLARAAAEARRRLWEPLAAHLPQRTATVFLCPDERLGMVPFAALPGKQEGRLLLEEVGVRLVPSGPALFDWLQAPAADGKAARLLLLGGVDYRNPDDPDRNAPWKVLPGSDRERRQVGDLARALRQPPRIEELSGVEANADAVLRGLERARWAHLATHGYFAAVDSAERDRLYDRRDFLSLPHRFGGRERVGAVSRNPLTLTGLVLTGANGRGAKKGALLGMLTAEAIAGRNLERLQLAVLSACDTALGEAQTGEGVFGLQRAFHLGGCRNVVASLWKVEDNATAALMALFYRKLWDGDGLPPAEALRQAQLMLWRHPESVGVLARGRGPDFDQEYERIAPAARPQAPPIEGPGRLARARRLKPPQSGAAGTQ
jgi:CHAT domain-containing protein